MQSYGLLNREVDGQVGLRYSTFTLIDRLAAVVLDSLNGVDTTAPVTMQEGRRSVICELNPEYAALARRRLDAAWTEGAAQMDMLLDQSPAA